jgi:hypothetical protein
MWLDPDQGKITSVTEITMLNTTGDTLEDIIVRLYPNHVDSLFGEPHPLPLTVDTTRVDGMITKPRSLEENTALRIPLPIALEPDDTVTLVMTATGTIEAWQDGSWLLSSFYPLLAVYEQGGWRKDAVRFAHDSYTETAFYTADITLPAALNLISTGKVQDITRHPNGTKTYHITSAPVRNFAMVVGDFEQKTRQAGSDDSITVRVSQASHSDLDTIQILRVAAEAVTAYEQQFGLYPYPELNIYLKPGSTADGWSQAGLILLTSKGTTDMTLRHITAREVAKQWWYHLVGNDIIQHPWLDEALAQYSVILYAEQAESQAIAIAHWEQEVLPHYRKAVAAGNMPVGLALAAYPNKEEYADIVLGKGAVFLQALRDEIGNAAFSNALATYYQQHRYGMATPADFQQACEAASQSNLNALFNEWLVSSSFDDSIAHMPITTTHRITESVVTMFASATPTSPAVPLRLASQVATATALAREIEQIIPMTMTTTATSTTSLSFVEPTATPTLATTPPTATPTVRSSPEARPATDERAARNITWMTIASASSTRSPEQTRKYGLVQYDAFYAVDGKLSTAWVEGAAGSGVGESLHFKLSRPITLTRIGVTAGFELDAATFTANNRVQQLTLLFSDGSEQQIIVEDRRGLQYFTITPVRTDKVSLVIDSVYRGASYDDTPLAEVELWGYGEP